VIQLAGGDVRTVCVAFAEPSISGEALLRRSGLAIAADVGMLGTTICRIDDSGCDYPRETCLCRCRSLGAGCTYWAYHTLDGDRWTYSILGAAARVVRDGDVDGWAWGAGSVVAGAVPPVRTFDQICAVADVAPTAPPARVPTSGLAPRDPATVPPVTSARPTDIVGRGARSATAAAMDGAATHTVRSGDGVVGVPTDGETDPDRGGATIDAARSNGEESSSPSVAPRPDAASTRSPAAGATSSVRTPDTDARAQRRGSRSGASPASAMTATAADRPGAGGSAGHSAPADRLALAVYAALVVAMAGAAVWLRRGR
ncbi:MAG: hypothetical protein ABI780_10000, partial [Ardenticatenales bacterium]